MNDFIKNSDSIISQKRLEIKKLQDEIREICLDCILKEKNIQIGDMIYVPSKNKYGIFTELHNEDVTNLIIKSNFLTKLGMPSKNITTVKINELEKVTEPIQDVINNNFSGEEFDANKALSAYSEAIENLKS